jgi:hypothetical protein
LQPTLSVGLANAIYGNFLFMEKKQLQFGRWHPTLSKSQQRHHIHIGVIITISSFVLLSEREQKHRKGSQ